MKQYLNKNSAILVLLIALGVMSYMWNNTRMNLTESKDLVESLNAEVETWKGKDSLNYARIQVIETRKAKDFLTIKTGDSIIKELQSTVKKFKRQLNKKGSVTIIEGETKIETVFKSNKVYKDLFKDFIKDSLNNEWINAEFGFKLDSLPNDMFKIDSTMLNLNIKNKYSVVIGVEPSGFLGMGKGTPFSEVKNYNPYTSTETLRTYQVSLPPPKKFGIGFIGGYILSSDLKMQPAIGVGLSYDFIRF